MSQHLTLPNKNDRIRKVKDQVAKYGVSAGGLMVLAALLMIFFYLLYVVYPIFEDVEVSHESKISVAGQQHNYALGLDEHVEIGYRFTDQPSLEYFSLVEGKLGQTILNKTFDKLDSVSTFAKSSPHQGLFAYGLSNGEAFVVQPKFKISFPNDKRFTEPRITYPLGEETITLDEAGEAIEHLAFSVSEEGAGFLFSTASGVKYQYWVAEENFMTDEIEWQSETVELDGLGSDIQALHISPDLSRAFVVQSKQLNIIDIRDIEEVEVKYQVSVAKADEKVVASTLLSGANSIMLANDQGIMSQWFEINGEKGPELIKAREFVTDNKQINGLFSEFYRKTFFATSQNGRLGVYHTTSEAYLFDEVVTENAVNNFAIAPRSNAALLETDKGFELIRIKNKHPEVTWSGLWQEVWYEGYPEPDYIWQSTSASDDFESKFSLVPISFGTIKAAAYAMLFSIPIGLAAAIYTAYFMPSSVRSVVKPTVEVMEALPTVILGFLAGLWLAPIIEENLPGVVVLMLAVPVFILLTAFAWHSLPAKIKNSLPEGYDCLILIPVILAVGYFSFEFSPVIESAYFGGDMRLYITDSLGIDFDQRNSFVVGIAMGFAVIPTIFSITEDAVFSVPKHLSQGSLALGASQWQTLVRVVLLTASPGIFSAVMMGLGRAVGETMIVLMATGNTPIMDWSIFQGMRTLAANIAVEMPESEVGSSHYRILFLAAFVLFIFTFVFNTVAEFVRQRLREKYSSL
ncbi:ABC transporter permease subunit [Catenovulum sp. SM1970]|uniref:ABC transporter permease subunit n=1 Tax=Marinifaba aquimaris TaxID=2741323 RepID=UPI001574DCC0|nr:ABC transporter permease subunit [Marinifaba aquimaris]NTS78330.1 ABC transporter permease subunit [Marinifaba aquimaris]